MVSLDLRTAKAGDAWKTGELEFEARRDGVLNGFGGWFCANLAEGEKLDTGPTSPETHWSQSYLAFQPRPVKKGTIFTVRYELDRDPEEHRNVRLTLQVGRTRQTYAIE